jgi:hypothetical protein
LSNNILFPKDYSLLTLNLLTPAGTIDFKPLLVELSYHEDLFNNTASGYLMVSESMGYIETLNLMGNEYIRIRYGKTEDIEYLTDKVFRVYKVGKRKLEGNMNTESYCLYFCSEELILSEQYKVSKSYKSQSVKDNIEDILINYLDVPDEKLGAIESTYGTYDFIIPNIKPFDAINWLSVYARPRPDQPGSDMILYENRDGFNFRSIQSLMRQTPYRTYSYNPKNVSTGNGPLQQEIDKTLYNVTTYEILDSFDSLNGINSGIFANRLISVDPLLRRYKITDFDYGDYITKATMLNKYGITNNHKNRKEDGLNQTPEAFIKLVFSNFNQDEVPYVKSNTGGVAHNIFAETYIPYRTAQLALANYTRVRISVPGDPLLTVGLVIGFDLLSINPKVEKKQPDKFYSGNYLITAVRHMITMNEYKTVLEISKDSSVTPYAGIDNGQALWKNMVKGKTKNV